MESPPATRILNALLSITILAVMMFHVMGQQRPAELRLFEKEDFNLTERNENDKQTFVLNRETSSVIKARPFRQRAIQSSRPSFYAVTR